ncbi:phage tail tape measure protein, partial [Vibrio fluvialis]|nr:phage tail tape measure protein [Vibrio fluvialis]
KIGEVKSLGVHEDALKSLQRTALDFSSEYGKSAVEFTGAAYDIQSAIAGLEGSDLAKFTKASGVLAAATKADTSTITDYMGTMYGIFKNDAAALTNGVWVEKLTGMTATAVQMFKTDGSKMSQAFTSLGANATSAKIAMSEQMAILGILQATMSGSEAGTKYKSFLAGVGKAQDKLGLSFTDSQGKMLPMLDILDKLKGKFGDTLDVAESDALKAAFG